MAEFGVIIHVSDKQALLRQTLDELVLYCQEKDVIFNRQVQDDILVIEMPDMHIENFEQEMRLISAPRPSYPMPSNFLVPKTPFVDHRAKYGVQNRKIIR